MSFTIVSVSIFSIQDDGKTTTIMNSWLTMTRSLPVPGKSTEQADDAAGLGAAPLARRTARGPSQGGGGL